jgi:hypothetical protein
MVGVVPLAFGAGTIYEYSGTGTLLATTTVQSTTDLSLPLQATTEYVDIIPETNSSALPRITLTGGVRWRGIEGVGAPGVVAGRARNAAKARSRERCCLGHQ